MGLRIEIGGDVPYCDSQPCVFYKTELLNQLCNTASETCRRLCCSEFSAPARPAARVCVYTFVLKPVRMNVGVTLDILSHFLYECKGKIHLCLHVNF
jgi:hypothetical protein